MKNDPPRIGEKIFMCKIKGEVNSNTCYECFKKMKKKYDSRPLCKKENVKEIIESS